MKGSDSKKIHPSPNLVSMVRSLMSFPESILSRTFLANVQIFLPARKKEACIGFGIQWMRHDSWIPASGSLAPPGDNSVRRLNSDPSMFYNVRPPSPPPPPFPPLITCIFPNELVLNTIKETFAMNFLLIMLVIGYLPLILWQITFLIYFEEQETDFYVAIFVRLTYLRNFLVFSYLVITLKYVNQI